MAEYLINEETLNDIADAIRSKSRSTEDIKAKDMATNINNINTAESILEKTIESYTNESLLSVSAYAFYACKNLSTVNFPNCITVYHNAFGYCYNLQNASFPNCEKLSTYAFNYCKSLPTIDLPNCSIVDQSAFEGCCNLQHINIPKCSSIGAYAFRECSKLQSISSSLVTTIQTMAFYACDSLSIVDFPNCTTIGQSAFKHGRGFDVVFPKCTRINNYGLWSARSISLPVCSYLGSRAVEYALFSEATFPACKTVGIEAFAYSKNVEQMHFPMCVTISSGAFLSCSKLTSLYLEGESVVTLGNATAFQNTPISNSTYIGTFGSIYVPASLVDSYKSATNWVVYADRITAIPEQE